MSVSVSFGSSSGQQTRQRTPSNQESSTETYVPQTLVLGMFLIILAGQIAVNMAQVRRMRGRRMAERERDRGRVIVVNGDGVRQAGVLGDHDERDGGEGDTVDTEHREDAADGVGDAGG